MHFFKTGCENQKRKQKGEGLSQSTPRYNVGNKLFV